MSILSISDLYKTYRTHENEVRALNGISLEVEEG